MSLAAALFILAQSAAPQTADVPNRTQRGVSVQVQASATIIRPARVTFENRGASLLKVTGVRSSQVQRSRDSNGTQWADFE